MINCKTCEESFDPEWRVYIQAEVWESKNFCPSCFGWWKMVKARTMGDITNEGYRTVVVDGNHFRIANEEQTGYFRGYGGAKFIINFLDGTTVTTTNLWSSGRIPEKFREHLPDNATFGKVNG